MEKFCDFFTLRPSDLITTLTYVLMDNFCPCFSQVAKKLEEIIKKLLFSHFGGFFKQKLSNKESFILI
jgi:hypothetical protein